VDIVADGFDAGIRLLDDVPRDMIVVCFGPDTRFAAVASPAYRACNTSMALWMFADAVREWARSQE
jgi:DNA-binding transcriptional LysR family regulator